MIVTAHFLTGAVIATKTHNPLLGLFFALLSHYILDALPHQEYPITNIRKRQWRRSFFDFAKIFIDCSVAISLVYILADNKLLAIAGGFAAEFPDLLTFIHYVFPTNKLLKKTEFLHDDIVHSASLSPKTGGQNKKFLSLWGFSFQLLAIALSLIFL